MTRREIAFLLIGLGSGLIAAVAAIVEFLLWFHHMFAVGFTWQASGVLLALPFLLIIVGWVLLYREKRRSVSAPVD
jgi:ABC-type antimicrobial peptide transport system permease subunit